MTCSVLSVPDTNPFAYTNAIRLHLLINAVLSRAATVKSRPSEKHPIPALDPACSWVRLLGRLLNSIVTNAEGNPTPMSTDRIEEELLDVLASMQFAAGVCLQAARVGGLSAGIQRVLERIYATSARCALRIVGEDTFKRTYIATMMAKLEKRYGHLATCAKSEARKDLNRSAA
jgi:hypothetical protein